jgi:transposase-like protein
MYHPICPVCRSSETVKFSVPRWRCNTCGRTFRNRRAKRKRRAAIEGYVHDRTSYVRLGRRWGVHKSTAYRRVQAALKSRINLLARTKRLLEECDHVLIVDGKHVRIRGVVHTLFVAWDRGLGKPIHYLLKEGGEKDLWYWKLLIDLRHIGYEPKAFISDGVLSFKELVADMYPELPHQRCAVHVFLAARGKTGRSKRHAERISDFIELLKCILWARSLSEARRRFKKIWLIRGLTRRERFVLKFLYPTLLQCFKCTDPKWKKLKLPRSSNAIENVMGQIEARFKTRRGAKSLKATEILINEILLRVKRQIINQ